MPTRFWSAVVGSILIFCSAAAPTAKDLPAVDKLASVKDLPDPFLFSDGSRVQTKADWLRRREELKEAVLFYEFGRLPPAGDAVSASEVSSNVDATTKAIEKVLLLKMGPGGKISTHLELSIPDGKGPFPVIITGDLGWGRIKDDIRAAAVKRGYIVAAFNREEIEADKKERGGGLSAAYPGSDFGALAAWAWGYSRVIDYLVTQPFVDKEHIAATGHSRGGKATLLAGALDERISLTAPNNSGCGGAGCYRFQAPKSEDIGAITRNFPHWFSPRFPTFVGQVDRLPFDQHSVKALVAPRALLSTEALGDEWANPEGTQQSHLAAKEVFKFLGAESKVGIVFREGGHAQTLPDWKALLDFADVLYFAKKPGRSFDKLAFPQSPKMYAWAAPPEMK